MCIKVGCGRIVAPADEQLMLLLLIFYFSAVSVVGLVVVDRVESLLMLFESIQIFENFGVGEREVFRCENVSGILLFLLLLCRRFNVMNFLQEIVDFFDGGVLLGTSIEVFLFKGLLLLLAFRNRCVFSRVRLISLSTLIPLPGFVAADSFFFFFFLFFFSFLF